MSKFVAYICVDINGYGFIQNFYNELRPEVPGLIPEGYRRFKVEFELPIELFETGGKATVTDSPKADA